MKKRLRNNLFCVCMCMFPMQVYGMDLAKLTRQNEREIGEISSSDEEEKEMLEVADLPPAVEMKKIQSTTGSALSKKSPKSINDLSSDGGEDEDYESEQKESTKIGNQKALGNGLFSFMRNLFKR